MTFPADWPPGCPPADAEDAEGEVFRIVKTDPPTAVDFETLHERGSSRGDPILRCGLSLFRLRADAEAMSCRYRNLGGFIARAELKPGHGKTKQTGQPSHTTWWPREGLDRVSLFTVVGEVS